VLHCVAVCCTVLQCVALYCSRLEQDSPQAHMMAHTATRGVTCEAIAIREISRFHESVSHMIDTVCCSVLQCVAVCAIMWACGLSCVR